VFLQLATQQTKSKYSQKRILILTLPIPPMPHKQHDKLVEHIQSFFKTNYNAQINGDLDENLKTLLENPLLKHLIFSNNQITIIDHSTFGYRYISDSIFDVMGYHASELFEKGMAFTLGLMHPDDLLILSPVFERVTSLAKQISVTDRRYFRFNYSLRFKSPTGYRLLYQQNIPLAYNDSGLPHLVIALVSNITDYAKNNGVHYSVSVHVPGQPARQLLTSRLENKNNPLTLRESEIVLHLANGMDTSEIAEKLFISEGTVRKHRQYILNKTAAKNSIHLVQLALANGWV
jgi:DNA-binding CsgD family transcriptional regulator